VKSRAVHALAVLSVVFHTVVRMLVVKIELWPGGAADRAREIGRLGIANVSDLAEVSDYVAVLQDDSGHESSVFLSGHRRREGFWGLLARAAGSRSTAAMRGAIASEWQQHALAISHRLRPPGPGRRNDPQSQTPKED
jgi:hypothetical protein